MVFIPRFIKEITPVPIKNLYRDFRRNFSSKKDVATTVRGQKPKLLSVEPTNNCNLNCPFCLVGLQNSLPSTAHDLLPRGFGFMDMDLFKKIARDAAAFGIETMQLHFQGEPLLHKKFPDMVKEARAQGLLTHIFTNGLPITENYAERILDSGLDMMRFSVDGASEETYQKNRVGGKFERVFRNMTMMVEMAKKRKSPIRLEWQFIALSNNEHEIEKARIMAEGIGINFFVKTFAVTDPELLTKDPKYHRKLHPKPCLDIYRAIFVYWNGEVVPCCYDQEGKCVVGNLQKNTLQEIWDSPEYVDLRNRIDNAPLDPENEPEICKSCLKWGPIKTQEISNGSEKNKVSGDGGGADFV